MNAPVYLLTGVQAAGKSTIAQAVAERLPRAVHVHGDVFRRWVVRGREEMTPDAGAEAMRQLRLRHALTASAVDAYAAAGFAVAVQDVVLGEHLPDMVEAIAARPLHVVVLDPEPEVVAARERGRAKDAYGPGGGAGPENTWEVSPLVAVLREHTPRVGTWLDTSRMTVDETVDAVLATEPVRS